MDADEHGYLDGGFIRVHLCSSVVRSFPLVSQKLWRGTLIKYEVRLSFFTAPLIALFNHGWTRINTDIWTGVLSVSICVHPWFVLFHWLCEVVEGNTNKVRGQTAIAQ